MKAIYRILLSWTMIISLASCVGNEMVEPDVLPSYEDGTIYPSFISEAHKPPYATRALIDAATDVSMQANFLRLNEDVTDGEAQGTYSRTWEGAYLLEASSVASPDSDGRRSAFLNPVQTYYTRKIAEESYLYYKSLLVSWSPMNCILHKNDDGTTAAITEFSTFKSQNKTDAYDVVDGQVRVKFSGLDGQTDIMMSNAVEAQQWHEADGVNDAVDYRYPLGHNASSPAYDNPMTYTHYLSAIRVHAYSKQSAQMAEMWGKILDVVVKDQPSECHVPLPGLNPVENPAGSGLYSSAPGQAEFSGSVDFSLIKTRMYGEDSGMGDDRPADISPSLEDRTDASSAAYLGYALIRPSSSVVLEIHTETGVYEVNVDVLYETEEGEAIDDFEFQAGYIYDIYLNFQTSGRISALLLHDGGYRYYDLTANTVFDVDDDKVEEYHTANCYIVHPGIKDGEGKYYDGYVFLATVAGNGDGGVLSGFDRKSAALKPKKAMLLWESSPGLITQVELMYGYVRFRTAKPDAKDSEGNSLYKEGNAVIAVYDSDYNVLWSWHIWITDKPREQVYGTGDMAVTMLDRNLGATAAATGGSDTFDGDLLETYGLYYQWGRKDPFMGPRESDFKPQSTTSATYYDAYGHVLTSVDVHTVARPEISDGVLYPMYMILPVELSPYYQYDWLYDQKNNLWGYDFANGLVQKTIYDPCPVGYRVPAESLNNMASSTTGRTIDPDGITYTASDESEIFFPYAGYKGVDRGMSSMTCAWKYVGAKADYMLAKTLSSGHRSRIYMSYAASWNEVGTEGLQTFPYTGNVIQDGANRRGAGSVRCVKDFDIGTIRSQLTSDGREYMKGEKVNLVMSASTPSADDPKFGLVSAELQYSIGSSLDWKTLNISGHQPSGVTWAHNMTIDLMNDIKGIELVTESCHIAFRLVVKNGFGLALTKTYSINYYPISISIKQGETSLTDMSLYWYESYNVDVNIEGMSSLTGLYTISIEGREYTYNPSVSSFIQNGYLDNEFTIIFKDSKGTVLLERIYHLNYTSVALSEKNSEHTGSGESESMASGCSYVIISKDDNLRHLYVTDAGTASLTRDAYSAYGVFTLEDFETGSYSSYNNVGRGYLKHKATGKYLSRNNSSLVLTDAKSTRFYFCSDWGTESDDNVDILAEGGYYMDSPNYSYIRLSTGGREHYKWYVRKVTNVPDDVN